MTLKRAPIIGGDIENWGAILNSHLSQTVNPTNGGVNSWTTANRPSGLTADDQGKTGANLDTTKLEQWNGTAWIDLTSSGGSDLHIVNSIFEDLKLVDVTKHQKVLCLGYWSQNDFGGGIFYWDPTSTLTHDAGRVFLSQTTTTGRWIRKLSETPNVLHYGAVPTRNSQLDGFGNPAYAITYNNHTVVPASSKFANLTDLQTWYPFAKALTDTLDIIAIQTALENNIEVYIPEGAYTCNRAIGWMRARKFYGAGQRSKIKFLDCNGFEPRTSTIPNDLSYVYTEQWYLGHMCIIGDATDRTTFDDTKCGFNFPRNVTPVQAQETPLMYMFQMEHMNIINFKGHGVKLLEQFASNLTFISVRDCGGHGIFLLGGNSTTLNNCYPAFCGVGYASFRILSACTFYSCTGNDTEDNWWGDYGATANEDGLNAYPRIVMINCNIEGQNRSIRMKIRGDLRIIGGYFQAKLLASDPYYIFDYGSSVITLDHVQAYTISNVQPEAFIKAVDSYAGRYCTIGMTPAVSATELLPTEKVKYVDSGGNNIYGAGVLIDIPSFDYTQAEYATKAIAMKRIVSNTVYLNAPGTTNTTKIIAGNGAPNVAAPVGSLYTRLDGGAGTSLYIKESGTGNTGWQPAITTIPAPTTTAPAATSIPVSTPLQYLLTGKGHPSGKIKAPVGTLYTRLDGGRTNTLYVKESGGVTAVGWRSV
jgi:hypothetical protein